jgi:hypothetical protein
VDDGNTDEALTAAGVGERELAFMQALASPGGPPGLGHLHPGVYRLWTPQ